MAAAAYLTMTVPNDGQSGSYLRFIRPHRFTQPLITTTWRITPEPAVPARVRLLLDGVPVTDWKAAPFTFTIGPLTDGHYLLSAEAEGAVVHSVAVPFVLAATGPVTGRRRIWVAANRYDIEFSQVIGPNIPAQVDYPGSPPPMPAGVPIALPALEPWSTVLPVKDLWVYNFGLQSRTTRRFMTMRGGDVVVGGRQHYFASAIAGPITYLIDGPRPYGTTGHTIKAIANPNGLGWYCLAVNGRIYFYARDGRITTLVGWRTKVANGLQVPDVDEWDQGTKVGRAWYLGEHDRVGQWPAGHAWLRPWGMATRLSPATPGHPADNNFHEFWVCNTFNHTIDYVDHRPAHHPPVESTIAVVQGVLGQPQPGLLDHPWDCQFGPDGWLYYVNRGDTDGRPTIRRFNPDTRVNELVVASATVTGSEEVVKKLGTPEAARAALVVDGPFGTASITLPNAMDFDSRGHLVFSEQCTGLLRRVDLTAKTIITVAALYKHSFGREITFQIDREGVCGPKDDMLGASYGSGSSFRISADGTRIGSPMPVTSSTKAYTGALVGLDSYPWVYAPGTAALPGILVTNNGTHGASIIAKRLPGQVDTDKPRYTRGNIAWSTAHPPHAALSLTHNGYIGPSGHELCRYDDAALGIYLSRYGLSPTEIADCIYMLRWEAQHDAPVGTPPPPPPPATIFAPAALQATQESRDASVDDVVLTWALVSQAPPAGHVPAVPAPYVVVRVTPVDPPDDPITVVLMDAPTMYRLPLVAGAYRVEVGLVGSEDAAAPYVVPPATLDIMMEDIEPPVERVVAQFIDAVKGETPMATPTTVPAYVTYGPQGYPPATPEMLSYAVALVNTAGAVVGTAKTSPTPFTTTLEFPIPPPGTYRLRAQDIVVGGAVLKETLSPPFTIEVKTVTRMVAQSVTGAITVQIG